MMTQLRVYQTMRLTPYQITTIKETAEEIFGPGVNVWLFGSRVDDYQRGGDIDLYIEVDETTDPNCLQELESRFWVRLQRLLGEQRIDVVTHSTVNPPRPIDQQARSTGIQL